MASSSKAVSFGQRHPRLTGFLGLLLFAPLMVLAAISIRDAVLLGLGGCAGVVFGIALVTAGHRMRGWKAVPFLVFVIVAGVLIDGYREFPQTSVGAAALLALTLCFTIVCLAVLAGLRRSQPDAD